jgi:hypothetical protein
VVRGWDQIPHLFGVAVTAAPPVFISFHMLVGDEVQSSRIQANLPVTPQGWCWNVLRHYPDYAERQHAVLSREGVPQVLGLGDSRETVMRVSPMLTGAPNKVRGRSANPESEQGEG